MVLNASRVFTIGMGQKKPMQSMLLPGTIGCTKT
jgi:hypothetical protein